MSYTHLTQDERYQIQILLKAGHNQSQIALLINRNKSTVSRELLRNRGLRGYRPKQASKLALGRIGTRSNARHIPPQTWNFVEAKLALLWSPEQISGYLKVNSQPTVSHESIYQHIYADKRIGGNLYKALRSQKRRKKRYGTTERRGTIPNKISIEQRPEIINQRKRYGDWEADLIIGAAHKQALVTLNERKSRYTLIGKVPHKTAQSVSEVIVSLLKPFTHCVHSLTTDNGKEFAAHESIAASLEADFYFAHPYSSWERGANENMNGLIRQFFPKKMAFSGISKEAIQQAVNSLNHRPRKCLNYKTPYEIFMNQV